MPRNRRRNSTKLDARIEGLANRLDADYTRYADDLLVSGGRQLQRNAASIAIDEGFELNHRKTTHMPKSKRQFATGVVLNVKQNIARDETDRLRATLFNCGRFGPSSQNRNQHPNFREHLSGRIQWVAQINPARSEKLWSLFEKINWTATTV